jgi:hypothetical protein
VEWQLQISREFERWVRLWERRHSGFRDKSDADVVRAVANVEEVHGAGEIANQVSTLNQSSGSPG